MSKILPYNRTERVADQIYQVIAVACTTKISDPRLREVEITRVSMTKDLRLARVYYHLSEYSDKRAAEIRKGLKSAKGFFKNMLREEMSLRYIPELEFFYDEARDLEDKIDELMTEQNTGRGS